MERADAVGWPGPRLCLNPPPSCFGTGQWKGRLTHAVLLAQTAAVLEPQPVIEPAAWVLMLAGWGESGWGLLPQPLLSQLATAAGRGKELAAHRSAAADAAAAAELGEQLRCVGS